MEDKIIEIGKFQLKGIKQGKHYIENPKKVKKLTLINPLKKNKNKKTINLSKDFVDFGL